MMLGLSRKLRVHGEVLTTEPLLESTASVVSLRLDSFRDKTGNLTVLPSRPAITFFSANYDPSKIVVGVKVWVALELDTEWEDVYAAATREKWIRPVTSDPANYEYSLSGQIFTLKQPEGGDRYVDVGFPISLTMGGASRPDIESSRGISEHSYVHIARGTLYGHIELEHEA